MQFRVSGRRRGTVHNESARRPTEFCQTAMDLSLFLLSLSALPVSLTRLAGLLSADSSFSGLRTFRLEMVSEVEPSSACPPRAHPR